MTKQMELFPNPYHVDPQVPTFLGAGLIALGIAISLLTVWVVAVLT